jgi:hypothetical protein
MDWMGTGWAGWIGWEQDKQDRAGWEQDWNRIGKG